MEGARPDLNLAPLLIRRRPQTDATLHSWIKAVLGYHIPRVAVTPGMQAPFELIADTFFQRTRRALILASRGSGKTHNLAISTLLRSHFDAGVTTGYYAAVEAQGEWGFDYLKDMVEQDHLAPTITRSIQDRIEWGNSSWARSGGGHTKRGITAFRCNRLVIDEVDLWDPQNYETANYMVTGTHTHLPERLVASTAYNAYGMMSTLLAESVRRDFTVYRWDIFTCATPDTLISTEIGLIRIDQLQAGTRVWSWNGERFELKQTNRVWKTRTDASILSIETERGETLKVTPDHLILSIQGWIEARDLHIGDRIACFSKGESDNDQKYSLSGLWHRIRKGPEKVLQKLLGLQVRLPTMWKKKRSSVCKMSQMPYGVVEQGIHAPRENCTETSRSTCSECYPNRKDAYIYRNQEEDAQIGQEESGKRWPSHSKRKQIARIVSEKGLCRIGTRPRTRKNEEKEAHRHRKKSVSMATSVGNRIRVRMGIWAILSRFLLATIQCGHRGARRLLAQHTRKHGARREKGQATFGGGYRTFRDQRLSNQGGGWDRPTLEFHRVIAISPAGTSDVWDCIVEDNHNFVAEGIVIHNCMERCDRCLKRQCPLYQWIHPRTDKMEYLCKGRGMRSDGFLPREVVVDEFLSTDAETFLVQKLLANPERKSLIYPRFLSAVHAPGPPPREVLTYGNIGIGIDWGFDHPLVFTVFSQLPNGRIWGIKEVAERFATPARELELAQELRDEYGDVPFFAGKDQPQSIAQLVEAGFTVVPNLVDSRDAGHRYVRRLLDPNHGPLLFLDPEGMPVTVHQLGTLHKDEKGREVLKNNDHADSARYALACNQEMGGTFSAGGAGVY